MLDLSKYFAYLTHFFYHSPISNLLSNIMTLHPDISHYYKFYDSRLTRGPSNKVKIKKLFRLPSFSNYWLRIRVRISVSFLQDLPIFFSKSLQNKLQWFGMPVLKIKFVVNFSYKKEKMLLPTDNVAPCFQRICKKFL